jgi:hypothetical protein
VVQRSAKKGFLKINIAPFPGISAELLQYQI